MAFLSKTELKDVFNGLSSLFFANKVYDLDGDNNTGYPEFSATETYAKGDIVHYTDTAGSTTGFYKFTKAHSKAAWATGDVTALSEDELKEISIDWDYELPVTVDTLQISQDDPTINHYKVIGLQGDWTSTAEAGDFTIQFTVPTKHTEVIKLAFGDAAYKEISNIAMTGGDAAGTWSGGAVAVNMKKVTGTIGLIDELKTNLMLVSNIALYAKPLYENPGTEPFAIQFSGSIETSGDSNFAWLTKQ